MSRRRYFFLIALNVAAIIIVAGFTARQTRHEFDDRFQKTKMQLKADKEANRSPELANVDVDNLQADAVGMWLPSGFRDPLNITVWIEDLWYVLIPLVVVLCLGIAFAGDRF